MSLRIGAVGLEGVVAAESAALEEVAWLRGRESLLQGLLREAQNHCHDDVRLVCRIRKALEGGG
jgi:hypothetical protein